MTISPSDLPNLYLKGGLPVNPHTGRIHGTFKHDPRTLRLSMAAPSLHQIPRGSTDLQKLVRSWFVTPAGKIFLARDFSGIEAVLVGFFAKAERYIRLSKIDIHSFFTAYTLYELEKKITFADLPQESWPDDQLSGALKEIKKNFKPTRETNKKLTHGRNYKETAPMAQVILLNELGVLLPIGQINRVMKFYDELFPEIPRWHLTLASEVGGAPLKAEHQGWGYKARNCFIQNPFGAADRFYDVVKWEKTPMGWEWDFGEDAKALVAWLPQSTARFIKTTAAQRVWNKHPEFAKYFRLFIHDEIFCEVPEGEADALDAVLKFEMEQEIKQMALPDGRLLSIDSEGKRGRVWADMK